MALSKTLEITGQPIIQTPVPIQEEQPVEITESTSALLNVLKYWNDDSYKLVFADYIEEKYNQRERADFIRVQYQLNTWSITPETRNYDDPFVDCRNIQPVTNAGTDEVCNCPRTKNNEIVVCEYHQLVEYQRELLRKPELIVGSSIMGIMPSAGSILGSQSNNNFGVTNNYLWNGPEKHNSFRLEKGFVVELNCRFQDWAKLGVLLVKTHPLRKISVGIRLINQWNDSDRTQYLLQNLSYDATENEQRIHHEITTLQRTIKSDFDYACLFWARQKAGFWEKCSQCEGSGQLQPNFKSTFKFPCNKCGSKGWISFIFE